MKTRSARYITGFHPAHASVVVGALLLLMLSALPLCAQEKSAGDDKGQKAVEQFRQYEKSDAKSENSQPVPQPVPEKSQPLPRPVPEYAQRAAEGLIEESSSDADPLGLLPGAVEPAIRQDELRGPGRWFFNTRIGQKFARFENGDIRRRPMMYWRRFADRQLPPIRTFLFLLFFNTTICLAFRKRVEIASRCVSKSFWKSLFVGVIFVVLMATGARFCFDSALYTPCALLILGGVELLSLAGLAVSSRTVGLALMNKLGYTTNSPAGYAADDSVTPTQKQSTLAYLAPVFIGTILFTLVALLPGLGPLPRLGTRFVMWFSLLGMGALVRTKLGRKELS